MKKDVIYIDIEDDITAIINKVKSSGSKIVALVPPKRSTVLNSAVNMKLLMKAAEEVGKRIVLVTSEASLLSLAGGIGLYVAPNLFTKPSIPESAEMPAINDSIIDGSEIDPTAPVGELTKVFEATESAKEGEPIKADKIKKDKVKSPIKFKVPSFDRFRNRLLLVIGGLLLIVGCWWWAYKIAPRASVIIKSQTSRIEVAVDFTADTKAAAVNIEKKILPAQKIEIKRNLSEPFTPSGKKNIGEKATGQVTIQNCDSSSGFTVDAGTILTSPSGLKFETLEDGAVPGATFSGGDCVLPGGEVTVNARAIAPGKDYNLASGTIYDIDGVGSLVVGYGGQMSGGTDKNVTVVAQKDVDDAKNRLKKKDQTSVLTDLQAQAGEDIVLINETYNAEFGDITAQPKVGDEASTGNVSSQVTYSVFGIKRESLKQLVEDFIKVKTEGGDQEIYKNGLDSLMFVLNKKNSSDSYDLKLKTDSFVGPKFDTGRLAEEISGKRYSEILSSLKQKPGVVDVEATLDPFWVSKAPAPSKIEIKLEVSDTSGS